MNDNSTAYFDVAQSWADERDRANARSRRIAWIIAVIAVSVAVLQAVALALLIPLKTLVPIGVLVDRQTGHVQRVDLDQIDSLSANEALRQSLVAQYVIARESFDPVSIKPIYQKVFSWSGGQARTSYVAQMRRSPSQQTLPGNGRSLGLEARITSVSDLGPGKALVRFSVAQIKFNGQRENHQPFVATIAYEFRGQPMTIEERLNNPLGFEVTSYRVSAEAVPAPAQLGAVDDTALGAAVDAGPAVAIVEGQEQGS